MSLLTEVITARDAETRNRSLDALCRAATLEDLLAECEALDRFRRSSDNLYERVRALFFLYAIHRFHIPLRSGAGARALIPFAGYTNLLKRRFEEALEIFLAAQAAAGPAQPLERLGGGLPFAGFSDAGGPGAAQRALGARQPVDVPRPRIRKTRRCAFAPNSSARRRRLFPILGEATPVRMDLSHSGWSDIFFLGMDFPEGARVLNISIDLSVSF